MVFLSNYLVFKIVLAALGRTDYPVAGDLELKYDNANKVYLSGGSLDYIDDYTLWTTIGGETNNYNNMIFNKINKTTTTAYETNLPTSASYGTFGINQDATRYVFQYPESSGYTNGKIQVYSGTPSDGYKEYGSIITPFDGDEVMYCSMSADGKYILVTTYNGGNDGYKMYKDTGSEYVYHSSYSFIGSYTDSGYNPAFVPSNNNFVITGTNNSAVWLFKLYVYDSATDTWTGKAQVTPSGSPTTDYQRGQFGKGFTYDGSYFFQSSNGATTQGEVWSVDWDANTMTKVWHTEEGSSQDGVGGAISPDNKYVVLAKHDGNPYRIYENTSGDWSTVTNVTSDFDLTGSGTSTVFGSYGLGFSGYSSENTTPLYIGQHGGMYGDGKFRLENWSSYTPRQVYINEVGKYSADVTVAGLKYKTNEVDVTGSITPAVSWNWGTKTTLTGDNVVSGDEFGKCIDMNGDTIVVGSKREDTTNQDSGAVYVFVRPSGGTTWTQQAMLKANDAANNDQMGEGANGVKIYGDTVAVGVLYVDDGGNNRGACYIFTRSGTTWTQQQKIVPGTNDHAYFGESVALWEDTVAIGGPYYDYGGSTDTGGCQVWKRNGSGVWAMEADVTTMASGISSSSSFGIDCSLYEDTLAVGGHTHNSQLGAVWVFTRSGATWTEQQKITSGMSGNNKYFGAQCKVWDNTLVVKMTGDDTGGTDAGSVWIYSRSGTTWSHNQTLRISGSAYLSHFVNFKNNLIVARDLSGTIMTNVWEKIDGVWTLIKRIADENTSGANQWGTAIAMDDNTIVLGEYDQDRIHVYNRSTTSELVFDGYNKLSLTNTPTSTSSKLFLGSNVYDIGKLTSDLTIETPGVYKSLTYDMSSNAAYFNKTTVSAVASTQKNYDIQDQILNAGTDAGYSNNDSSQGGFGNSIDMSADGTRMIVGNGHYTDTNGRAWLYHLESGSWVLKQTWDGGDRLGSQVAMNEAGTRAFALYSGGGVKIWDYSSGAWDTSASGTYVITHGSSISAEVCGVDCNKAGDVVIIGSGSSTKTWVYRLSGVSWSQDEEFSIKGSGVAMNGAGTRCFMGDKSSHKVWESNYVNGSWGTETEIISGSMSSGSWPISLSTDSAGETLCIMGNSTNGDKGAIYERASNGSWSASVSDVKTVNETYGTDKPKISYDGTVALFGHQWDNSMALGTGGHALLYTKSGSTWSLAQTLLNPSDSQDSADYFGGGVALAKTSKDRIVVSALGDDNAGTNYGAIYTYVNAIPEYLDFDMYSKLSINNITPTSTSLRLGSDTYDIGTVTNIYIEDIGTYYAVITASDKFAFTNTVVSQVKLPDVVTVDWNTTSLSSITASNGDTLTTNVGGTWDVQTDSTMGKMVHIQTATTSRKFEIENSTQSLTSFVGTGDGVTISFYMKSGNPAYGSPKWFNDLFQVTGSASATPNVYAQVTYDTGQTYSVTHDKWMYVQISYKWDGSNFVDYTFYIIDENGDQEVKVSKSNVTTNNGLQSSNKFWETNNKWFNMEVATFRGDINLDFYLTNFRFENKYRSEFYWKGVPPSTTGPGLPKLTFDTYNKLSIENITPTSSTLKHESKTYDLGTASTAYIKDVGTYSAEIKDATNFVLSSNVVSGSIINNVEPDDISGLTGWYKGSSFNTTSNEWEDVSGNDRHMTETTGTLNVEPSGSSGINGEAYVYANRYSGIKVPTTVHSIDNHTPKYTFFFVGKWTAGSNIRGRILEDVTAGYFSGWYGRQYSGHNRYIAPVNGAEGKTTGNSNITGDNWALITDFNYGFRINGTDRANASSPARGGMTQLCINNGFYNAGSRLQDYEYSEGCSWAGAEMICYNRVLTTDEISFVEAYLQNKYSISNDIPGKVLPSLTFDGYNKLTLSGLDTDATSNVTFDGNTYDIGTATNIYISENGTYDAESKSANTFALTSKAATIGTNPYAVYANYRSIGGISASSTSLHNENITTTYSVTMWAKSASGQYFFRTANSDSSTNSTNTHGIFSTDSTGQVTMPSWTNNNSVSIEFGNSGLRGDWHFYGFEFEGTSVKLHLDGAAPITGTTGYTGQTHNRIRFDNVSAFATDGSRLAEFAVYNRALTDAEFVSIYNNGKPNGPDNVSSGRVSWFKCLSGAMGTNSGSGGDFDCTFTEDTDVPDTWKDPSPSLTFDGYKLVLKNFTPTSSTLKYGSNTYDIGTKTNVYIEDVGTYNIEAKNASTFVFASNVSSGTIKTVEPVITGAYSTGHALTYDGKLYAWGKQGEGEAGTSPNSPEDWSNVAKPTLAVKNPNSSGTFQGEIVSIWNQSKRGQSRWAKTRDGRIWLTGDRNSYCTPFDWPDAPAGSAVSGSGDLKNFTDVSLYFGDHTQTSNSVVWASGSERATQVLMENGDVWSYGDNSGSPGVLGQGTNNSYHTPTKLNISNVTKIVCNGDLVMALDSSNVVWMWGRNEIGNSTLGWGPYNVPTNIMGTGTANLTGLLVSGETVTDIECGSYSMFAITSLGTVYATGHNAHGQLGQGNVTAKTSSDGWVKIDYFTTNGITTVNKLYTGQGNPHVFADTSDGWYCWGNNGSGQLGLGDTTNRLTPVKFTGVSNIKKFGTVDNGCYAITEDGKYYAWGSGSNYTRGDSDTGNISFPKYIDRLPNILAPSFEFDGYDKVSCYDPELLRKVSFQSFTYNGLYCREMQVLVEHSSTWYAWNWEFIEGANGDFNSYNRPVTDSGADTRGQAKEWYKGAHDWRILRTSNGYKLEKVNPTGGTWGNPSSGFHIQTADTFQPDANGIVTITFNWNSHTAVMFKEPLYKNGVDFSSKFTKGTTTYDVGEVSIITVPDPGTYGAQLNKGDFAIKSATVPATKTSGLYTWAFHHGNFDNAYGDGDILTARDNGRFYADTPAYTGDIGTITPNPNINSYTYTISFKVINQSGTTIYDGTDGSIEFTVTQGTEYAYSDFSTSLNNAINTALSGGPWSTHAFAITSSTTFQCSHNPGTDTHTYTLGVLNSSPFHSTSGGEVYVLIKNPYYTQTTYTFAPASSLTANVLMVAGGGSGGSYSTGGGGAGGLVYKQNESISTGAKTIVIGKGGEAIANPSGSRDGLPGKDTTFLGYTAIGGGAHGTDNSGGSGGAGASVSSSDALQPTSATGGFGNQGGTNDSDRAGGGGGGAGGVGENGDRNTKAGDGGIGKNYGYIFGTNYGENGWFAAGGGGGDSDEWESADRGFGGKGGGGHGVGTFDTGQYGQSHTGGGGGGSGQDSLTTPNAIRGGGGGSGIVLLQTNVATPNVNNEVKTPEPNGFLIYNDNLDLVSRGPIPNSYNSNTVKTLKLPDGSEGPVYYSNNDYTYFGVGSSTNTEQGDGSWQTIESVFMPIETGNYTHIASLMHSDTNLMTLGIDSNNKLIIQHNNNTSHNAVTTLATSDYTMEHGKWHHLVLTTDYLGNAKAYVNGYLVASGQWTSMNSDKGTAMFYRIGVDNHDERVYIASTSRVYFAELSPKEIMKLASSVGCGPKLEYDGLNTLKILNTEPGSTVRLFTSNVADTSNVFIVADDLTDNEYTVLDSGKYYAEIKGSNTFTITRTLDVTGTFPLYQYPPIDGTTGSITEAHAANSFNNYWTISGAASGNGQYKVKCNRSADNVDAGCNHYDAWRNNVGSTNQWQTLTNPTYPITFTILLPSAKTIRKYRMFPLDHANPNGSGTSATPGTSIDPTLPGNGGDDATKRPKSWVIRGSNNDVDWTDLDTVSDKPISIYGDLYSIDSPASYQYYQVSITANNGGNRLLIGDIQLWGDA